MYENQIFSILIGIFAAACIFYLFCYKIIYRGPDSNVLKFKIYKYKNKCYVFDPQMYLCL